MENTSGIIPVGRAVLVKPYQPNLEKSIIELPDTVKLTQQTVEQRAIVVSVGPEAWKEEAIPRAYPGNKVLISAFAGYMAKGTADGEQYRLVNDRDIFAIIEVERHD